MDLIKKNLILIVAGALFLGAIVFYFLVVSGAGAERDKLKKDVQSQASKLKSAASGGGIPNRENIELARKIATEATARASRAETFVVNQGRDCQTRRFYDNPFSPLQRIPVTQPVDWTEKYAERAKTLTDIAAATGFGGISLPPVPSGVLPTDVTVKQIQLIYWFNTDMVDMVMNREPLILERYLNEVGNVGIKNMFELVRNWNAKEPQNTLTRLVNENNLKPEELRQVLKNMLFADDGWNIRGVLEAQKLRDGKTNLWDTLNMPGVLLTPEQNSALLALREDNDWSHLHTVAMDLRTIRYKEDLIAIFQAHGETEIVEHFKRPELMSRERLTTIIDGATGGGWTAPRVARVIGTICSIRSTDEYRIIYENHRTPPVKVQGFSVKLQAGGVQAVAAAGPDGGPAAATPAAAAGADPFPPVAGIYYEVPFTLSVQIEMQKIPQFLRRLYTMDWYVQVNTQKITRTKRDTTLRPATPTVDRRGNPIVRDDDAADAPKDDLIAPAAVADDDGTVNAEPQRIVTLDLTCIGHSFYPMKRALEGSGAPK